MKNILQNFKLKLKNPLYQFLLFGIVLLTIPLLSSFMSVTIVNAVGRTLILYIVALGFALLIGYGGLASLGTASFILIGTTIAYSNIDVLNLPFIVTLILGVVIALVVGTLFGIVSLRIEGMYLAIVTLGMSEILTEIFTNLDALTGGPSGTPLINTISLFTVALNSRQTLVLVIIAVVIAMILTLNLINSPFGRALLSLKNNDSAAQAMGINLIKYRLMAFIVSTVYAVLAGILYMGFIRFAQPAEFGLALSLNILAAVVIGGSKSIWGVFAGTFVIFGLDLMVFKVVFNNTPYANLSFIISGILVILVTMYYPNGLAGLVNELRFKYKKRALRRKVGK